MEWSSCTNVPSPFVYNYYSRNVAEHDEKVQETSRSIGLQNIAESEFCLLGVMCFLRSCYEGFPYNTGHDPRLYYFSSESPMSCEKEPATGRIVQIPKCAIDFLKNSGLVRIKSPMWTLLMPFVLCLPPTRLTGRSPLSGGTTMIGTRKFPTVWKRQWAWEERSFLRTTAHTRQVNISIHGNRLMPLFSSEAGRIVKVRWIQKRRNSATSLKNYPTERTKIGTTSRTVGRCA